MFERRAFLRWATAIGGVLSGVLAGAPALRAFLSPTFRRRREEKWIRMGEVDQFDPDVPNKIDFVDAVSDAWVETRRLRSVWVYTSDGENFRVYGARKVWRQLRRDDLALRLLLCDVARGDAILGFGLLRLDGFGRRGVLRRDARRGHGRP